MRSAAISVGLLLVPLTTGCFHGMQWEVGAPPQPEATEETHEAEVQRDVAVSYDGPGTATEEAATTTSVMPKRAFPDPVFFRLGAGYGALGQIDLSPCRDQGLGPGYLHLRVTFRGSGRVVRAAVERPAPPPAEALLCIGEQLQAMMVPVFDGGDVTLSKSLFVN